MTQAEIIEDLSELQAETIAACLSFAANPRTQPVTPSRGMNCFSTRTCRAHRIAAVADRLPGSSQIAILQLENGKRPRDLEYGQKGK